MHRRTERSPDGLRDGGICGEDGGGWAGADEKQQGGREWGRMEGWTRSSAQPPIPPSLDPFLHLLVHPSTQGRREERADA